MIILASRSKRRSQILSSCGIKHKVVISKISEDISGVSPKNISIKNARLKAVDIAMGLKDGYVIGADTVVQLGKNIIGKPKDAKHAKSMLKEISGKSIAVYTGLCVVDVKKKNLVLGCERSIVKVKKIKNSEFSRTLKLLAPYDKAGGFSIEGVGSMIFDDIKGSYFNILGLPMILLKDMFNILGVDLFKFVNKKVKC
ncbi:MAG: nucleoside triphosphate pyrophosphatase [Candidatus Omnitrophota bacterium]